ncbi:hypothetical protein GCM10008955_41860 [Deinococcus malanensis]|uniref:Uncharacterized protein n=1 Tax=Deinococcus malanensis TaxID=1706855 RepID=A0ABQ2F3J4_9DEIO|nr:hypothetical protein [Deinococcus malanensis]GGK43728.1 hypothetical protein GCM10008955_41860 [Deinococcus malanensis]
MQEAVRDDAPGGADGRNDNVRDECMIEVIFWLVNQKWETFVRYQDRQEGTDPLAVGQLPQGRFPSAFVEVHLRHVTFLQHGRVEQLWLVREHQEFRQGCSRHASCLERR